MATMTTRPAAPPVAPPALASAVRTREERLATGAPPVGAGRDRFVDAVRAIGTLLVITLHWLMADAAWDGTRLHVGNALASGPGPLLTWLQPLPLLFFAAGASAAYRLARHPVADGWRAGPLLGVARVRRLLPPVLTFAGVWLVLAAGLMVAGVPDEIVGRVARIVPQPLWFLGVSVLLTAATPLLRYLLRTGGAWTVAGVVAAPFAVDALRFGAGWTWVGPMNVVLAWAVPYVLGMVYADRRAAGRPLPRGLAAVGLVLGAAGAAVLVATGPYPLSLIGMPGDAISNLAPPTAPVVAYAVAQVCLVLVLARAVRAWGERSRIVGWVGARSMPLYLWHLTAVFLVVGAELTAGALPAPWSAGWAVALPVRGAAAAVVLLVLMGVAARVSHRPRPLGPGVGTTAPGRPMARSERHPG
jgi:fucose 4-O-acetylase-like acetyltransferase